MPHLCYNGGYSMDIVALYALMQEETLMNKKLGRLIHPGMGTYFMVMI